MNSSKPGFPVLHYPRVCSNSCLLIKSVMLPNFLILCYPLLLLSSIFPSIRVFSSELAVCNRWPKYWSFIQFQMSFSISPSNEYSGLISLKIDLFHLLAVPTFRSLPQFEGINSLASCLLYSLGLTTIHDHWKDHSLNYVNLCRFSTHCLGLS